LLVAKERFDYQYHPQERSGRRVQTRRVHRTGIKTKVVYCTIVLVTLCLAFLVASRQAQIASTGYDILALKKQLQIINLENQSLQRRVDEFQSLEHIEYVATVRLGMQKPELAEGVQFVPVEYSKAGTGGTVGIASADETEEIPQAEQKRNSLVQALAQLING